MQYDKLRNRVPQGPDMANLITLTRFVLLFVLVALAEAAPPQWQLVNMPLLVLIIALDGLDGWVARRRGETSRFGSLFDIVVDRVVENVLWIVLADLDLVPVWVAIVFITRGVVVDGFRYQAVGAAENVFGMMWSRWGRWLVASRFMRALYGTVKGVAFGWLLLIQPLPDVYPELWAAWSGIALEIGHVLVLAAVVLCLARGLPVVIECLLAERVIAPRSKPMREAR